MTSSKTWTLRVAIVLVAIGVGYFAWQRLKPQSLPHGIASGNGRIEAVEIDIAAKIAGRIKDILVNEGDFVRAGQTLANMDTQVLTAQRKEAEAQLQGAIIGVDTAKALVVQRKAEKQAAIATVAQREAELEAAHKRFLRTEDLSKRGVAAIETLESKRAASSI